MTTDPHSRERNLLRRCRGSIIWSLAALNLFSFPVLAALLPGAFVLERVEEQWKEHPGIVLERQVLREDCDSPVTEKIFLKGGKVRVESSGSAWVYPPGVLPGATEPHRPGIIDAVFFQPPGKLSELLASIEIWPEAVVLERLPNTGGPLPFTVVYRLGASGRRSAPHIKIEKDRWIIRAMQFREHPEGPLWHAEYDGQAEKKELPSFLPSRILVYRAGVLYESISVLRRLDVPIEESLFTPPTGSRKSQIDGR